MNRSINKLVSWVLVIAIILGINIISFAQEVDENFILELDQRSTVFKEKQYDVSRNKEWTIKFNQILDENSVIEDNVFIWNKTTSEVVNCFVDTYADSILIYPKLGYFNYDTDYVLYITDKVKSVTGKTLSNPIKMEFKTIEDKYIGDVELANFNVSEDVVYVNGTNDILFRVSLIGNTNQNILLFECDEYGNIKDIVGEMKDSGDAEIDGDDAKGDNIYSYRYGISEVQESIKYFTAKLENGTEEQSVTVHVIEPISDNQADEAIEIVQGSNDYFNQQLSLGDFEQAKEETIKWLEMQEAVVEIESLNENIVYLLDSNIICAIIPEEENINGNGVEINDTENSTTNPSNLELEEIREQYRKKAAEQIDMKSSGLGIVNNQVSNIQGNYSVLLTSPSHEEFVNRGTPTNFEDDLKVMFGQYPDNFTITTKYDSDADLDCYKKLDLYDIITINTHGGVLKSNNIFHIIFGTAKKNGIVIQKSGEKTTSSKQKEYEKELKTGKLVLLSDNYFGLTPEFISQYNTNFQDSIIYSAICEGAYNDTMSDTYLNNGASVYFGYDESVLGIYTHDMANELFQGLLNNMSALESMNSAIDNNGSNDVEYYLKKYDKNIEKIPAKLLLKGDGNFRFSAKGTPITNGDFEKGSLFGWSYLHDSKVVTKLGELKPTQGNYMGMISTGLGTQIESDSYIEQKIYVPDDANYLLFDYNFISEEYPYFVNEDTYYDDTFEVYLGEDVICHESAGSSTWYPISGMDFSSGDGLFGHTGWKHKIVSVDEYRGRFLILKFRVWDVGDSIYDSAAIIDNIRIQ